MHGQPRFQLTGIAHRDLMSYWARRKIEGRDKDLT
jgi:hypothetical protein